MTYTTKNKNVHTSLPSYKVSPIPYNPLRDVIIKIGIGKHLILQKELFERKNEKIILSTINRVHCKGGMRAKAMMVLLLLNLQTFGHWWYPTN